MTDLERSRARLDELDEQILCAIGARMAVCREVAAFKARNQIPMMQPGRLALVRANYAQLGEGLDLPADLTESLYELLTTAACEVEDAIIAAHAGGAGARP
jgi:chorismate mutase